MQGEGKWDKKLRALPWYGGKGGHGKAEWICSLLPWIRETVYVEPFGGMAGVLITRAPTKVEIFNDLDERIVNWWRVIREHRDEFGELVECVPWARKEHEWASTAMDDPTLPPIRRALAFHICCLMSAAQDTNNPAFSIGTYRVNKEGGSAIRRWRSERVADLAERFWNVQLECKPAEDLIERLVDVKESVIYCDPPYLSKSVTPYRCREIDMTKTTGLVQACKGKVAISGLGSEWDHLDWQRHERSAAKIHNSKPFKHGRADTQVEVVWTNYDASDIHNYGGLFASH